MTAPLPPTIYGPIYPISPSLHLGGVFTGSVVEIAGTSTGNLATITYTQPDTEPWLLFTRQPVEGEYIIVHQTAPSGLDSGDTPHPPTAAQVIAVPDPLPNPGITQPLHFCSDFISLDALIPGAFITVQVHGTTIVHERIERPSQNFRLDPAVSFGSGDTFTAFQEAVVQDSTRRSGVTESKPPVEDLGLRNPLPHPVIDPPAKECERKATFTHLITGASVYVTNHGVRYSQDGVTGPTQELKWTTFPFPWERGPITAQQAFARCGLTSDVSTGTILPADPVKPPVLPNGLCSQSPIIHLSGLADPSELQVQRLVAGHPELTQTRNRPNGPTEIDFPIPLDWPLSDPNGAVSFQFVQKTACGTSPPSPPLTIKPPDPSIPKPAILSPLFECSKFIYVQHATVDSSMFVRSTDGTILSDPFTVIQTDFVIHTDRLYHPLVRGKSILVFQFGCGRDWESEAVPVNPAPIANRILPAPRIITALRPGDQTLDVVDVIPGATVFALVDGKYFTPAHLPWTPDVEAISVKVTLKTTQPLGLNQRLNPIQQLCGVYSSLDANPVVVSLATLTVTATPSTITKGAPTAIQVDAVDRDTGAKNLPQWGSVSFNGLTFRLGERITINVPIMDARSSIAGTIAATGFNAAAPFAIALANPPPPTFILELRGTPATFITFIPATLEDETVSLQSISWTVTPLWDTSARATLSGTRAAGQVYLATTKTFNRPPTSAAGVSDFIEVTGTATFLISSVGTTTNEVVGRLQRPPSDTSAKSCIVWLLSFHFDVASGALIWDNGQIGTGSVNPFGFSC